MKSHRPYRPQEYDPIWKEKFQDLAERLRPLFGENFVSIEHVGSTSIEGMFAKPQIDILLIVKNLLLVKNVYPALTQAGFVPRGTEYVGIGDEYVTEDTSEGIRLASIHIFEEGHPEIEKYRVFREHLRSNKEDRDLYIATKKQLYSEHSENYHGYDSGKMKVIEEIRERANKAVQNK